MTVILPKDYHAQRALESRRILCLNEEVALKQDIRPLRIGILNIMPEAETYEFHLLYPMGRSVLQIEPIWIRLESHEYKSSDKDHLNTLYLPFKEVVAKGPLDGLIVTGAPVEELPFEKVVYWEEVKEILTYARRNVVSTLGMCWGALAMAKLVGVEKTNTAKKVFGVYKTYNLDRNHPITGELDDVFDCPQSRHAGIDDDVLERERDRGNLNLLARSAEAGYVIFETADHRYLMHIGHPEYNKGRLVEEYLRDARKGRNDVEPPRHFDLEHPVNTWRAHRNEFFSQWIKYIYDCISLGRPDRG